MLKSNFYKLLISGFDSGCIGCEQNPDEHRRMKASLSAAFSTKALLEQELIVNSVIDSFVERIGYEVKAKGHVDMAKWFEMMAFDLMGEMTFGESFHCIQKGLHPLTNVFGVFIMLKYCRGATFLDQAHFGSSLLRHCSR
jgi:cytochrome P450